MVQKSLTVIHQFGTKMPVSNILHGIRVVGKGSWKEREVGKFRFPTSDFPT